MKNIKDSEFSAGVSQGLVLVDFWADWCEPCKALALKLEEVEKEFQVQRLSILKLNVDENHQTASQYGVRGIPAIFLFLNGQKVDELSGNVPKEQISDMIKRHL